MSEDNTIYKVVTKHFHKPARIITVEVLSVHIAKTLLKKAENRSLTVAARYLV